MNDNDVLAAVDRARERVLARLDKRNSEMLVEFEEACTAAGTIASRFDLDASILIRIKLITEEYREVLDALEEMLAYGPTADTRAEVAKELADLLYVTYGTAVCLDIPIDAVFAEVHRSNMSKLNGATFRKDGKLLKGPNYAPPDIKRVLQST